MSEEPERNRSARAAAELALVRVVHHYDGPPDFVVLGGLVPALLCSQAPVQHIGTTDIDVQVNLEIQEQGAHASRLERALRNADFAPDGERAWRWELRSDEVKAVVKFELLADLDDQQAGATVLFADCEDLGAANLRGTGYAARDVYLQELSARDGGVRRTVDVQVTGLGGFLMAKVAAAHGRRSPKDWYDIAYVLLHNDDGGPQAAADRVVELFGAELPAMRTALVDLHANFHDPESQGSRAYANQVGLDMPEEDPATLATDAQLAVAQFCSTLLEHAGA